MTKELILKLQWKSKAIESKFSEFCFYDSKLLNDTFAEAYKKRNRLDKIDMITVIFSDNDSVIDDAVDDAVDAEEDRDDNEATPKTSQNRFKHYYFDSKTDAINEDCLVSIRVKTAPKKQPTFEEKVGFLTAFMKKNGREPEAGDKYNDFDVGKFYVTSNIQGDKAKEVNDVVSKYISQSSTKQSRKTMTKK